MIVKLAGRECQGMLEPLFPQPIGLATNLGISLNVGTSYDSLFYFYRVLHPEMQHCIINSMAQFQTWLTWFSEQSVHPTKTHQVLAVPIGMVA